MGTSTVAPTGSVLLGWSQVLIITKTTINPSSNMTKGRAHAARSTPRVGGADKMALPYFATKASIICCSFIPCLSLLAISSRRGVADEQLSIGQTETWLLQLPHWQANTSPTFLTSGLIV